MKTLMPQTVRHVQPPLKFVPAAYNPWVMRIVHWLLPVFLRIRLRPWLPAGINRIEVSGVDPLVDLYQQFEAGQARFLMAPRHVEVDDPLSGLYLCSRAVAKAAQKRGIQLKQPVHIHFIYERGMTIWAGKLVGWL
ncbi:MAG: 1-acyl-sn-glycerol-3-phosphate acyltransferase, partial [Phormidesmis sp.]